MAKKKLSKEHTKANWKQINILWSRVIKAFIIVHESYMNKSALRISYQQALSTCCVYQKVHLHEP